MSKYFKGKRKIPTLKRKLKASQRLNQIISKKQSPPNLRVDLNRPPSLRRFQSLNKKKQTIK